MDPEMHDEDAVSTGKVAFSKAHIELKKEDIGAFQMLKVGFRLRLVLVGEIGMKSEDKVDHEADNAQHGMVEIALKSLKVVGDNEFTDLFKDELES